MGLEGQDTWDDPDHQADLLALAAGVAVRDRFAEHFLAVHRALFDARHVDGADLRDREVVRAGAGRGPAWTPTPCWPRSTPGGRPRSIRQEHERCVGEFDVFGVPTFIVGDDAVFARLMNRPDGDGALARRHHRPGTGPHRRPSRAQRVQAHPPVALIDRPAGPGPASGRLDPDEPGQRVDRRP